MPKPTWVEQALADCQNPDTADDLTQILHSALELVLTDSIEKRSRCESVLRGRLARLRRIYDRA